MALAAPQQQGKATSPSPAADLAEPLAYRAAVRALDRAHAAISGDDIEARCAAVSAATEAVTALYLAVQLSRSGAKAQSLGQRYGAILEHLLRINVSNDSALVGEVIALLEPLRLAALERAATSPT